MKAKRKLLISMLAIVFVLLAVVATVAIAFALTQQTITTTLNIGYVVEDIDGTASATYTIGGVTERLTAKKGNQVIGDTLVFHAGDTEDAGNLMFPEGQIPLSAQNDNIVIQYTYSNTGAKHFIASMSFDGNISADNMKVEYSIDGTTYSENRYAVVVPAHSANKSYWIRISIDNKAKSASFTGDFKWLLSGCDEQEDSYLSLTSVEFQQANDLEGNPIVGGYSVSLANTGSYVGELVFPSSVNGDPVTKIVANYNLTQEQINQVTSVYIPDSVTTIGNYAFYEFKNLQTVTFEQNETAGASVKNGTGLTIIGDAAFWGCTGLTSIELPAGLTSIAPQAFYDCTGLTSIELPSSLTSIGDNAFSGCKGLTSITVASGNTKYHSAGNCLIETASKKLIQGCKTSVIPTDGSVTSIGEYAFKGCTGLTSIELPSSVTSIGSTAFLGCTGLTSIELPSSVTSIGEGAFADCTNLKNITLHTMNESVRNAVKSLANANGELNLTIDTVTSIPLCAFQDCAGLTTLIISDVVENIGSGAFADCESLTTVVLGTNVNYMHDSLAWCDNLHSVTFKDTEGWTIFNVGEYDENGEWIRTSVGENILKDATSAATFIRTLNSDTVWEKT